jgi:hypothetical protein
MWKAFLITLPLAGCVTTDDNGLRAMLDERATRTDLALVVSEIVCKQQARTMVQISRCEVRR